MRHKTNRIDQKGIVSFMVTLIMMMVISLIVIGFTQVSNRNRREALDRQLSAQAFYAAESGVNKAITEIKAQALGSVENKDTCTSAGYYSSFPLDGSNVAVTCIMVNTLPSSIKGSASQTSSFVAYLDPVKDKNPGSPPLDTLTFSWDPASGLTPQVNGCTGTHKKFPDSIPATCAFGLLRVELFQFENNIATNPLDNDKTTVLYLQPLTASSGTLTILSMAQDSHIVGAACDTEKCRATIDLDGVAGGKQFYARLSSLYREIPSFEITGVLTSGDTAHFKDGQAIIDSTGRAQDVLRRVQVRYSLGGGDQTPPWAVAGRVCKKLRVIPAPFAATNDPTCNYTP